MWSWVCLSDHHVTTVRLCSPERHPRPDTPARFTSSPSPTQYVITSHAWIDTITTAPVCYFHRGRRTEGRTFGGGERSDQVRLTQGLHLLLPPPHHLPQRKVILLLRCSSKILRVGLNSSFPHVVIIQWHTLGRVTTYIMKDTFLSSRLVRWPEGCECS